MKKVFDPRTNEYVESHNPALILLDILWVKFHADQLSKDIIPRIKEMADYYDELIDKKINRKEE